MYICGRQSLSQHRHSVLLSGNVVDSFWPAVKTRVSDGYRLPNRDKLFLDPRLGALVHCLLGILLLMTEHLKPWCDGW